MQTVGFQSELLISAPMVAGMSDPFRLYYAPDNASLCVRLLLERLETAYETVLVDRKIRGQKDPAYLALNPNGFIPTLVTPRGAMFETAAILLWLADQNPGEVFPAPDDPDRGQALTWLFWLSNTLHPNLRHIFYPDQYGTNHDDIRHAAKDRLKAQMHIADQAHDILARHDALACYYVPMLRWIAHYGRCDLSPWPNAIALAQSFETRPFAVAASQAEGLGETPFSAPKAPNPPEGSAI